MTIGMVLGCGPTPSEVVGTADGSTGPSTSTSTTSGPPMLGSSSSGAPGADGSGDATGQSADTSSDGGTTMGVQPATSTGEAASTSTGTDPAGTSTGVDPGPSCDDLFGAAPGYIYCMETPAACYFNADTGGSNCNAMCTMLGSVCVEAFDNPNEAGQECVMIRGSTDTCDTNRGTELCACSK
jgi:hypothetical protein